MSSPLQQAGALSEPSSFAALHTNRVFTGLWTNRSPLRDAATSYLQEKYYSASRQDSIWDGVNTEISSKLTLIRRPGTSVYNSQTFPAIGRFYDFRVFSTTAESIRVMADTGTAVYDATGPNTKLNIWNKSAGAGKTFFQSVGNVLYMGNGVDQTKWIQSTIQWAANTAFRASNYLIDPNGNIQEVSPALSAIVVSVAMTGGSAVIQFRGGNPFPVGATVTPSGFTAAPFLNGNTLVVSDTPIANGIEADFPHANLPTTGETGTVTTAAPTVTGGAAPNWNEVRGGATFDGGIIWINKGGSVQAWGPAGPQTAPTVAQGGLPTVYPKWTANTIYSSSLLIVDTHGNIQKLTTSGVTGAAEPAWNVTSGGVTNDGSAQWTNRGTAGWQRNKAYAVGDLVSATFTYYIFVDSPNSQQQQYQYNYEAPYQGQQQQQQQQIPVTVTAFFRCAVAGVSGGYTPAWVDGFGSQVIDNEATWTNTGTQSTWAVTAGPNAAISLAQTIVDANGNLQTIQTSGKSGAAAPAWATVAGAVTSDNLAAWTMTGVYSAAQTQPQSYAYAYGNSVTGDKSNASPASASVILGVNSLIIVQGFGSSDSQVDIIPIYRTLKGGSTQLLLDEIPNPGAGQVWTYYDTSSDDALTLEVQAATALQLTPPPAGAIAPSYHLQRIFVAVQNVLSYSSGPDAILFAANGNSGFPPANFFTYPSKIVRTWPCALGLLVFTTSDIWIVLGSGTASDPLYTLPFLEGVGLLSWDAFAVQGTTAYIITTSLQLLSLDPGAGVVEVGFPIADRLQGSYTPESHLTFHSQSSEDTALYAGDGLVGWYRMAATTAPESGFNWSPQAVITGGCTALRSVEVQPGQRRLLLGPQYSGPILQRDRSVNTDNTALYVAWATLGSIVMAQPGQLAELGFFTLESMRTGTRTQLAVLMGEISGTFSTLLRTRQDPPLLPPATTLYGDRYAFNQNGNSAYCRHFQMRIGWAAEDAANELLTFTIYGALLNEAKSQ